MADQTQPAPINGAAVPPSSHPATAIVRDRRSSSVSSGRSARSTRQNIPRPATALPTRQHYTLASVAASTTFQTYQPPAPINAIPFSAGPTAPVKNRPKISPKTPQRKPVQHKKSPLSAEAFISPPNTATDQGSPACNPALTQDGLRVRDTVHEEALTQSQSPEILEKRMSAVSRFLPFKSRRKAYQQNIRTASSPLVSDSRSSTAASGRSSSAGMRPMTPATFSEVSTVGGSDSVGSHGLRKKLSGTFWPRKPSRLHSVSPGADDPPETRAQTSAGDGRMSPSPSTIFGIKSKGSRDLRSSPVERPESRLESIHDGSPIVLRKKKSANFWRRKSSQTLAETTSPNGLGKHEDSMPGLENFPPRSTSTTMPYSSPSQPAPFSYHMHLPSDRARIHGADHHESSNFHSPDPMMIDNGYSMTTGRSPSPPPQIPGLLSDGGTLGIDMNDIFGSISQH